MAPKAKKSATAATPSPPATNTSAASSTSTTAAVRVTPSPYDRVTVKPSKVIPMADSKSSVVNGDSLLQQVNSSVAQSNFPFYLSHSPSMGRQAIANRPLTPGTLLLRENACPWIVHRQHEKIVCHTCAKPLGGTGTATVQCKGCSHAFYCSPICAMNHKPLHDIQCDALTKLDEIATRTRVDLDLLRITLAYIAMTTVTTKPSASSTSGVANSDDFHPTITDVKQMISHSEDISDAQLSTTTTAVQDLLKLLPSVTIAVAELVEFICRVNSNAHGLTLADGTQFGLGLFPLCAIFNHACYPNAIFTNDGNRLVFRVIRDVKAGEELFVNYVGLYQSRWSRRADLLTSKKFLCFCRRCNVEPNSEEEREKFANDHLLGGIYCFKRSGGCTGIYREVTIDRTPRNATAAAKRPTAAPSLSPSPAPKVETKTATPSPPATATTSAPTNEPDDDGEDDDDDGDDTAATTSSASATSTDAAKKKKKKNNKKKKKKSAPLSDDQRAIENDRADAIRKGVKDYRGAPLAARGVLRCSICDDIADEKQVIELEAKIKDDLESSISIYGSSIGEAGGMSVAYASLQSLLAAYQTILHPSHEMFFHIYLPLINCCNALKDYKTKLDYCKIVIGLSESIFPRHFLPCANYYQALADTLGQLITTRRASLPKTLLLRYRTDRCNALQTNMQIYTICRGENDRVAKAAAAQYKDAMESRV